MKTDIIEKIAEKNNMECNGYAYFNYENFEKKNDLPCYIPENAEEKDEVYSYQDLVKEVKEFKKENKEIWKEKEFTVETLVNQMFEEMTWEFPSTYLANLTN